MKCRILIIFSYFLFITIQATDVYLLNDTLFGFNYIINNYNKTYELPRKADARLVGDLDDIWKLSLRMGRYSQQVPLAPARELAKKNPEKDIIIIAKFSLLTGWKFLYEVTTQGYITQNTSSHTNKTQANKDESNYEEIGTYQYESFPPID